MKKKVELPLESRKNYIKALEEAVYAYSHYDQVKDWCIQSEFSILPKEHYGMIIAEILRVFTGKESIKNGKLFEEEVIMIKDFEQAFADLSFEESNIFLTQVLFDEQHGFLRNIKFVDNL